MAILKCDEIELHWTACKCTIPRDKLGGKTQEEHFKLKERIKALSIIISGSWGAPFIVWVFVL
jgi:hypothetical protein